MKCIVNARRTGHVRISTNGLVLLGGNHYCLGPVPTARPDPYNHRRQFVYHNGITYYVTASHLVYETNIGESQSAYFNPDGWVFNDKFSPVPVTLRKVEKVEWVFL
jgi:hypothetical protein